MQQEDREQRPLLADADLDSVPALQHLEPAENAELQGTCPSQVWLILRPHQAPHKGRSSAGQAHRRMVGQVVPRTGGDVSITRWVRWVVVVAVLLSGIAASSHGANTDPPSDPSADRPSTVVVSVREDGFQWADAGVGAAAMLATTLLALGVVLTVRPGRGTETP